MAGTRLLQALAAAGRLRSAAVAMGRRRCPLPRQPLGAHQALLGLGPRASSLVPLFSTNAVEGEGAAIAGAQATSTISGRFKTADPDAQKGTKAYAFNPLGTGTGNTAEAEDADKVSMGEVGAGTGNTIKAEEGAGMGEIAVKVEPFGVVGAGNTTEDAQEGAGEEERGDGVDDGSAHAQKTADGCFYDDPRLRAFLEKFVAEKSVVSAAYVPRLTEALELERTKHSKERLHSDMRHLVLTVLGVLLEVVGVALLELYLQTQGGKKEGDKEKKDDEEMVNDDEKKVLPLALFLFLF